MSGLRETLPQRLRAAGIHLFLSGVAFAVALYLILCAWYPGFHFRVDGGWQGVRIMAAVDLVLGPLLTLVIFDPRKSLRAIAFDLSCIGLAQAGALAWGFYAIHSQHPVAISYQDAAFHPVPYVTVAAESVSVDDLRKLSPENPPVVWVRPPAVEEEKSRISLQLLMAGTSQYEDPFFFVPLQPHWDEVKKDARPDGDVLLFDYAGRYGSCVLAFSAQGRLVEARSCVAD